MLAEQRLQAKVLTLEMLPLDQLVRVEQPPLAERLLPVEQLPLVEQRLLVEVDVELDVVGVVVADGVGMAGVVVVGDMAAGVGSATGTHGMV